MSSSTGNITTFKSVELVYFPMTDFWFTNHTKYAVMMGSSNPFAACANIITATGSSPSEPHTSIYKYIQIYTRYFVFVAPKFSLLLPPLVIGFYQFIEAGRSQIRPFIRYSSPTNSPEMDSNLKNTKNTERNKIHTNYRRKTKQKHNGKFLHKIPWTNI